MKPLVRFTLTQTVLLNLIFVLLIVGGSFAILSTPVDRYPEINFGEAIVTTRFTGASPTEVETLVTKKIEEALEDLKQVEYIKSASAPGFSSIKVKFQDDVDYDSLYDEMRFKVLSVQAELPEDADPPSFNLIETSDWLPVISVNLVGNRSNRALSLMGEELKIPLRKIPGVKEVRLQGEYEREFHVVLDPVRMRRLGVTYDDVATALQQANVSYAAGDYVDPSGQYVIKVDEKFRDRQSVVTTIVRADADGSFVRVEDVISSAGLGYRDPSVITSVNGRDSVSLEVLKSPEGNALSIKKKVLGIIAEHEKQLTHESVEVVYTQDSTVYINDSMSTLGWNLFVGMLLVSAIIWYFMGFRNACLTTIGIPFSFMVTMILMYATGNSLNEITLFAFVLVSGIIVDDAIVVIENIYRRASQGEALREAIVNGTAEVFLPVVSATMTTVAAFLPMLIMTGSTGEFFALIPKAVSYALVASLIECLFMVPLHYLDFGPRPKLAKNGSTVAAQSEEREHVGDNLAMRLLRPPTVTLAAFTLRHRLMTVISVFVLFVISMVIMGLSISGKVPLIRIQFFPDDYKLYYVIFEGPITMPLEETSKRLRRIAEFVMKDGKGMAESASSFAGFYQNEEYEQVFGDNLGQVVVTLPSRDNRQFDPSVGNDPSRHLDFMRTRILEKFGEQGVELKLRAEKDGPPTGKAVNVRALGTNAVSVARLSEEMFRFLRENPDIGPYLVDLDDDQGRPSRIFRFRVNEQRTAEYGLTPQGVASLAAGVLDGRYIGKFRLPDEEIDLKVRVDKEFLTGPESALSLPLLDHASGPVRLGDLCSVEAYMEQGSLNRYAGNRAIAISANIKPGAPTSTPAIIAAVRKHFNAIQDDYPGASLSFSGEFEDTERSYTSLAYAFGIAVLLIYIILATQFQSYGQPLIILSAVIFSLIGVIFGKLVTQSLFTVNSFIAVVGVTGVVVNDSLVLIDFINRAYRRGLSRHQAIMEGIRIRLRPILLTTLTTSLGLLPMAIGFPYYSTVWGTMASTFVTGLCTATFLTLFVVPVLWDLLEGARLKIAGWRGRPAGRSSQREDLNSTQ